ncbi:MAG: TonB-dependent receptor [Acidobacteriaceae bacterium]|nr:TonB-dependent receptor [Acidobacteriaceae bacterium]
MCYIKKLCGYTFLLSLLAFTIRAQTITTGDVSGTVTDQSGASVANATVNLKSVDTGESRTATTNDSGAYRFTFLKPGTYTLQATSTGLSSDLMRVAIEVGQAPDINLVAKVQSTKEIVEVNTAPPVLETDNANLSTTFTTQQVLELPAPGGDITTVAFTAPGVVLSTGGGYGNFSSHGLPGTSNLFTINGDDYNDPYLNLNNSGASNLLLGQDEISEASVVSNAYSVQYGRQAGAQVNYVTKSGSNQIHADLLFNFNNHLMNANDFFNNALGTPRPYDVSRQWGADIGGPIWKNKLFFYSDSEGIYYSLPSAAVVSIPSPQLQTYILGHVAAAQAPLYTQAFGQWNSAPGVGKAVPVVTGSGPLQDVTGNLGCGKFASTLTPAPGGGVFGSDVSCALAFNENGLNTNKEWLETHRVDWNISDKQKIFFRFKGDHGYQPTFTDLVNPSLNAHSIQPQYEGQINHTYVISPTTVNNFIVSFLWYSAIFGPSSTSAAEKIFPFSFTFNDGGPNGAYPPTGTGGFYELGGFYENNFFFPQGRDAGQGQIVDDLSFVKGKHTLKVGVNYRRNRVTDFSYESNTVGLYTFNSLTDFVNGVTDAATGSNYQQKFSPLLDAHIRFYNIGAYLQDEWAVKPNLKITYGIRFDRTANPLCVDKCFSNLNDAFTAADFSRDATLPYNSSILSGQSHAYYGVDSVVPDPRFGVVWSPNGSNGIVVRGGVGLFSDLEPGQLVSYIFNNPPFPFTPTINSGQTVNTASDPASAAAAAQNEYNAFKTGFFAGDTLATLSGLVPGFGAFNYFSVPHHLATPEYAEWSFEVEQPIGAKNVLVATYSGNHGYNELLLNPWPNAYAQSSYGLPFAGLPAAPPDARFAQVTQLTNNGYSNYDGLTVQFRRTFSHGFQGQVNYTWSHALDVISNGGANEPYAFCSGCAFTTMPTPTVAGSYGNADYDIRHNLTADFVWDIPWKPSNRLLYNVLGNWTVSSKFYIRSGTPFSVYDGLLGGALSPNLTNPVFTVNMLASATGPLNTSCGVSAVNTPCFNSSQFVAAEAETAFGNLGRNAFRGPGYTDIDTSLFKNFNLTERLKFQFGASAFNVMNHPNFQNPNANISEGGLGTITATAVPPTSAYGAFQGSAVSGRVLVVTGRFQF